MRVMRFILASLGVVGLISAAALAQEGHPIKGSWLGDFGPNKTTRTQVFLVMDWDGKAISGMINPGTDNIPIKNATLTPPTPPPPTAGGGRGRRRQGAAGGQEDGGRGYRRGQCAQAATPPAATSNSSSATGSSGACGAAVSQTGSSISKPMPRTVQAPPLRYVVDGQDREYRTREPVISSAPGPREQRRTTSASSVSRNFGKKC